METKSLKQSIAIPEWYEAKNVQIINGSIVYELVEIKKSMRDELKEKLNEIKKSNHQMAYIGDTAEIEFCSSVDIEDKNTIPYRYAESFLALMELTKLNWVLNGCRELEKAEIKAYICKNKIDDKVMVVYSDEKRHYLLNFVSFTIAKQFNVEFKELIETAKPLL